MKKTLLAAALMTGFAGIAQAETSVTLYGVLDTAVGYERIKADGFKETKTGLFDGNQAGNRWGLKGTEDLGNGLRATFQLESGFTLSDGEQAQGGRLFGRHATVGLAGDSWGQIDVGRQTTVGSRFFVDVHGQHWGSTGSTLTFNAQDTNRMDNSVVYMTPNYSGFQFGVGYSFNASGSQEYKLSGVKDQNKGAFTTGLRYANGPIAVALSYDQTRLPVAGSVVNPGTPAEYYSSMKNSNTWALSGSYDFEVVAVSLAFGQDFDGRARNSYGDRFYDKNYDYNNYSIALAVPVGEGKLSAQYGYKQTRKEAKRDAFQANQQQYSIAYSYPLSKRTNVYAYGGYAKNYLNMDDVKRTHGAIGVRHQF